MIIYGSRNREKELGTGHFHCPKCDDERDYVHKRVARYFTLFFIPLFPIKTVGEYGECQGCGRAFKPLVLQGAVPGAGSEGLAVEGTPTTQPKAGRSVSPGCLLALGITLFLVGGVLALAMSAAQLSGPEGPDHNLTGFMWALIFCPLPLLLLGLGLGAGGVVAYRKAKGEEGGSSDPTG